MVKDEQLSVDTVIDTLTQVLRQRYGSEALKVAERQVPNAGGLPERTWRSIIDRLKAPV